MQRLFPAVDAITVLQAVQGLSKTHGAFAFITGVICFALHLSPLNIMLWALIVPSLFFALRHMGVFFLRGQVKIPEIYSRLTGWGIVTIITVIIGLIRAGVLGTIAFFIARVVIECLTISIDSAVGKRIGKRLGYEPNLADAGSMYFAPIKDFFHIYVLYASRVGATTDTSLSDEELAPSRWAPVWDDFASKWPMVVARYTDE